MLAIVHTSQSFIQSKKGVDLKCITDFLRKSPLKRIVLATFFYNMIKYINMHMLFLLV